MARRAATAETSPADPIAQGPDGSPPSPLPGDMVYYWESFGPSEIRKFPAMLIVLNPDGTWQVNVHKPGLVRRGNAVAFADQPTLGRLTLRE